MTLLGVAEIAELLNVKRQTVSAWRYRGILPPADYTFAAADLWQRDTIERWARQTGRWPHD